MGNHNISHPTVHLPKIEFPQFYGDNPRAWVQRCEYYFQIYQVPEMHKVGIAAMHLRDKVEGWFQSLMVNRDPINWQEFVLEIIRRFENKGVLGVIEEFKHLKQKGSVEEYRVQFEDLRVMMLRENPMYDDAYFKQNFLRGLKEEIKLLVGATNPTTLQEAYEMATKQELVYEMLYKRPKPTIKPYPNQQSNQPSLHPNKTNFHFKTSNQNRKNYNATPSKPNNLCHYCKEPWQSGHRCRKQTLNAVELEGFERENEQDEAISDSEAEEDDLAKGIEELELTEEPKETATLSMAAANEGTKGETFKFQGTVKGRTILMLLDTGSTTSFLDLKLAESIKLPITKTSPMMVTVANGQKMKCDAKCVGVKWEVQGYHFKSDLRLIELGVYDMILGNDWLEDISPLFLDMKSKTLKFNWGNKEVKLAGEKREVMHDLKSMELCLMIDQRKEEKDECQVLMSEPLEHLLESYSDLFQEPKSLPPKRKNDHTIPLKSGTEPVNLRPYRYSFVQKTAIEDIVEEMLNNSIITPSQSPFAAPALLVKKKDGSWRLCVDYRKLNAATIKNKYPISVIDDLLDELKGASIFSKIDLRSGYHQIRMKEGEEHKTAFRTHHGHFEFKVMPFGLTNAPASFQCLMNDLFAPKLRKGVLVFFDNILVYSTSIETHLRLLQEVLETLRKNKLFAKKSKCAFGMEQIEYLGHIISKKGVSTDPGKIEAMVQWPIPKTIKDLRGFLGLTGYYRKFVKGYGSISRPLTELLKKGAFKWTEIAQVAFDQLKKAMVTAPVLQLPDFSKSFTIEADASEIGVGAVLSQEGRPIAYMSKALGVRSKGLSTYEKELMAVVMAIQKWRHYLQNKPFVIKTDHESLKHLLQQKLTHPLQHKVLTKFIGLEYQIEYKKGKTNMVADALSRSCIHKEVALVSIVTELVPDWISSVRDSYENDPKAKEIKEKMNKTEPLEEWSSEGEILKRKNKIYVGKQGNVRTNLIREMHGTATGGHSGIQTTYQRLKRYVYWPGMKNDVCSIVKECEICQMNKHENVASPGLLQPLPIPYRLWSHINMDFIEGLPKSEGKDVILVVVDRLSKYAHFIALAHPFSANSVAKIFMNHIHKLHGLPKTITTDRDKVFTSNFWKELFKLLGCTLQYSTAYHPQTDGQTERVNQCLETYLRCMCSTNTKKWMQWLSLAEFWYNTSYHSSLKCTPFEALYGYTPPDLGLGSPPVSRFDEVNVYLKERQQAIEILREKLNQAQSRMKQSADKRRTERVFEIGDWVYLKLQPYRQVTAAMRKNLKLSAKYYGPFKIEERIGQVAYRLKLPDGCSIHPIFHVSQLKKKLGEGSVPVTKLPSVGPNGEITAVPEEILDRKVPKKRTNNNTKVKVKWSNLPAEAATWEDLAELELRFPEIMSKFKP
ncbi:hypothetical protein LUZ61_016751 [Rhynchospora tenuis]|uniref:Ty3/gypsy retrotransposon protein n=1 Tax=Rhynchospora tenuis TaxID=198213 RepID=A0AAD6EKB6_9POAL|nr:hypothetical protein LUZ61_016751 [Rhynchospora tenuis]